MRTLNDTLTQQLRSIRTQKAFSIESIAERLGVSPEAYVKIETGETDITLRGLENLAKALEVSASELFATPSTIISHNSITAETSPLSASSSISHSNIYYIGISSEVLEKLLKRIDTLENELEKTRTQK